MSAREELILVGAPWGHHNPDGLLDAFKAEVLREAAEKIRGATGPDDSDQRFLIYNNGWYDARTKCADLIDPDKENSADGTEADRA